MEHLSSHPQLHLRLRQPVHPDIHYCTSQITNNHIHPQLQHLAIVSVTTIIIITITNTILPVRVVM